MRTNVRHPASLFVCSLIAAASLAACSSPAATSAKDKPTDATAAAGTKEDASKEKAVEGAEGDKTVAAAGGMEEGCLHADGKMAEGHEDGSCEHGEAPAPGATGHFGSPFANTESLALSKAIEQFDANKSAEEVFQVRGEITSVCQAKGCWMVVKDGENGDVQARILMKDHAFTVPMDGSGKQALVEGTMERKTLTEAQVKHIEKDAGRDPEAVSGERSEVVMTAHAVEILAST